MILVSGIIIGVLIGSQCNKPENDTEVMDLLRDSLRNNETSFLRYKDSVDRVNQTLSDSIWLANQKLIAVQQEANQSEQRADHYATLYAQAKKDKDTVKMITSCDSIIIEYNDYKEAVHVVVDLFNNIIEDQSHIINNKDSIILAQQNLYAELRKDFEIAADMVDAIASENSKIKNKRLILGPQVGFGYTTDLKPHIYVGIGITYKLVAFK